MYIYIENCKLLCVTTFQLAVYTNPISYVTDYNEYIFHLMILFTYIVYHNVIVVIYFQTSKYRRPESK